MHGDGEFIGDVEFSGDGLTNGVGGMPGTSSCHDILWSLTMMMYSCNQLEYSTRDKLRSCFERWCGIQWYKFHCAKTWNILHICPDEVLHVELFQWYPLWLDRSKWPYNNFWRNKDEWCCRQRHPVLWPDAPSECRGSVACDNWGLYLLVPRNRVVLRSFPSALVIIWTAGLHEMTWYQVVW